jgi:hypothetical protein
MDLSTVTAVIINYRTPDLTLRALSTFKSVYPTVKTLLIDNGSGVECGGMLVTVRSSYPDVELIVNEKNLHHGPAMHQAMGLISTPMALFLESDCTVLLSGFIEEMAARLSENEVHYAAGQLQYVNWRGFQVDASRPGAMLYCNPWCMLIKRELYRQLPRFELHGAPLLRNMRGAHKKGFKLIGIELDRSVSHDCRGTAGRFGYGLGFKGIMNYVLNKLGI